LKAGRRLGQELYKKPKRHEGGGGARGVKNCEIMGREERG
jgi:hypothetical protein